MMAFYKEHKVNPVAGCLPMLLQMPVFIVMYQVIHGLSRTQGGVPRPKYIGSETQLYQDLVKDGGKMMDFGFDLARRAADNHPTFGRALPYFVLIALVVVAQYVQTKQMQGRSGAPPNPQMVMMQRVMPAFFGVISFTIAAGVNIYFLISSLFRITQQTLMYQFDPVLKSHVAQRVREVEAKAFEKPKGDSAKMPAKSNGKGKPGNANRKGGGNKAKKGR